MAFDLTELVAELGDYSRDDGFSGIVSEVFLNEDWEQKYDLQSGITDERPMPTLIINDMGQPYKQSWDPKANVLEVGARKLKVQPGKVDLQIDPRPFYTTWLGKVKTKGLDPYELPFAEFFYGELLMALRDEIQEQMVYFGVLNPAGSTSADINDGFGTILAAEIAAFNITPEITGVLTPANIIDSVELVYDAVGEAYKKKGVVVRVAPEIKRMYDRGYRNIHGQNANYDEFNRAFVDGTNAVIDEDISMTGSQRIISTLKDNFTFGVDDESDLGNMIIEKEKRNINVLMDFALGCQFKEIHDRALAVNEQL